MDITSEVKVSDGRLTIPGAVIHRVGLMAAKPGDISDPGLVLVVEGLTQFVPKKPMKPGMFMSSSPNPAAAASPGASIPQRTQADPLVLWYDQPAQKWTEALPLGNGRLGAMVFGDPTKEHLQLNENTVWSGQRHYNPQPEMRQNLPAVRQLLFDGKYVEAQALAEKTMTTPKDPRYGHYQPLGDLHLDFDPWDAPVTGYRRQLDLDRAVATTSFRVGDATFTGKPSRPCRIRSLSFGSRATSRGGCPAGSAWGGPRKQPPALSARTNCSCPANVRLAV